MRATPDVIDGPLALAWVARFAAAFSEQAAALGDMDRLAGDGDFATNLGSALQRVEQRIADSQPATFGAVFSAVSRGFLDTGGTSGPLFGMWFREISKAAGGGDATVATLAAGVGAGLAIVGRYGGAAVGDSTMVDAMEPAARSLEASAAGAVSLVGALRTAATAARAGAESTRDLVASKGRASYVGEAARGVLDPGAVAVAMFFEAGADVPTGH